MQWLAFGGSMPTLKPAPTGIDHHIVGDLIIFDRFISGCKDYDSSSPHSVLQRVSIHYDYLRMVNFKLQVLDHIART